MSEKPVEFTVNPLVEPQSESVKVVPVTRGKNQIPRILKQKSKLEKKSKREFYCKFCGKFFDRIGHCLKHERTHTGETPYDCDFCDRKFRQLGNKRRHIKEMHIGDKLYVCDKCGKKFARLDHLRRHSTVFCLKAQFKREKLQETKNKPNVPLPTIRGVEPMKLIQQIQQPLVLPKPSRLPTILSQDTIQEITDITNPENQVSEKPLDLTMKHKENQSTNGGPCAKCQNKLDCAIKFGTNQIVFSYKKCTCNESLSKTSELTESLAKPPDNSFPSKSTNKTFEQTSLWKPIKCELCYRRFTRALDLYRHEITHDREQEKKVHQCGKCDRRFIHQSSLKEHWRLVHCKIRHNKAEQSSEVKERSEPSKPSEALLVNTRNQFFKAKSSPMLEKLLTSKPVSAEKSAKPLDLVPNQNGSSEPKISKPFKCKSCDKSFRLRRQLYDHERKNHAKGPDMPEIIGSKSAKSSGSEIPTILVTNASDDEEPSEKERLLKISPLIPKAPHFLEKEETGITNENPDEEAVMLDSHQNLIDANPGIQSFKKYPCHKCSAIFIIRKALKKHLFHVHSEWPFDCQKCRRKFRHKEDLLKHLTNCKLGIASENRIKPMETSEQVQENNSVAKPVDKASDVPDQPVKPSDIPTISKAVAVDVSI